jgi:hypothetical protein
MLLQSDDAGPCQRCDAECLFRLNRVLFSADFAEWGLVVRAVPVRVGI